MMATRHKTNERVNCGSSAQQPVTEQFPGIRETASIIFTNFDMIHASILPHEDLWRKLDSISRWHDI
jgi:ATP-dependent helicase YprA (DUF1998 family)